MVAIADHYIDSKSTDLDDRFAILLRAMSAANEMHLALSYPGFEPYTFGVEKGKKYARVFVDNGTQRFVCFFVQMTDDDKASVGDVWKADGWKAPARNFTRGNIMTPEGIAAITLDRIAPSGYWYHGF